MENTNLDALREVRTALPYGLLEWRKMTPYRERCVTWSYAGAYAPSNEYHHDDVRFAIVLADSIAEASRTMNEYRAEHLAIFVYWSKSDFLAFLGEFKDIAKRYETEPNCSGFVAATQRAIELLEMNLDIF